MRIVLAGGTGFLGRALTAALRRDGHVVVTLTTRTPADHDQVRWSPGSGSGTWMSALERADAVVNLAGTSIAGRRWTAARKAQILDSRIAATRALAHAIDATRTRPVFLSSSGVGVYGVTGDDTLTETSPPGSDFLSGVCRAWEDEALGTTAASRVILLRTGLVLDRDEGALPRIALPFRLGLGGRLGSGRQSVSWIHVDDWVGMVCWMLHTSAVTGPVNLTAPEPVPNAMFSRELGRALRRPSWLPAPAFALRILLGEMADALLLGGQKVVPEKALSLGYGFKYSTLERALREIYPTA